MSQEKPSLTQVVDDVLTLEAHQSVMGDQAKEIVRHYDTPSVVFYFGNGTKDRSMGVIDLPCVVGGQNMQIKMHVVPGDVPCLLRKSWLKENGAVLNTSSEELLLTKKQITAPMSEGPSGHFELDLCSREKDFGEGRTGTLRPSSTLNLIQNLRVSPSTPSRALVTRRRRSCTSSSPNSSGKASLSAPFLRRVVLPRAEPSRRNHVSGLHRHAGRRTS